MRAKKAFCRSFPIAGTCRCHTVRIRATIKQLPIVPGPDQSQRITRPYRKRMLQTCPGGLEKAFVDPALDMAMVVDARVC